MIKTVDLTKTKLLLKPRSEKPPYQGKLWDALARQFAKLAEERKNGG